jgi:gamma-glutamyltranspeptidase / glutathione hydrolase
LTSRGHDIRSGITGHARAIFGRAQIIKKDRTTGVLWAGSDGRADGCAIGY